MGSPQNKSFQKALTWMFTVATQQLPLEFMPEDDAPVKTVRQFLGVISYYIFIQKYVICFKL